MKIKPFCAEKLTYADLVRLLKEDDHIQALILNLLSHKTEPKVDPLPVETKKLSGPDNHISHNDLNVELSARAIPHQPAIDPLRQELASELSLLKILITDNELCDFLLGTVPASEGQQLKQFFAVAAQWDRILQLWDFLANRCKQAQRRVTYDEHRLLLGSLKMHNLIWADKAACLFSIEIATTFDYRQHERGNPKGEQIIEEWLPGLKNPGGQMQKKPLVKTQ